MRIPSCPTTGDPLCWIFVFFCDFFEFFFGTWKISRLVQNFSKWVKYVFHFTSEFVPRFSKWLHGQKFEILFQFRGRSPLHPKELCRPPPLLESQWKINKKLYFSWQVNCKWRTAKFLLWISRSSCKSRSWQNSVSQILSVPGNHYLKSDEFN